MRNLRIFLLLVVFVLFVSFVDSLAVSSVCAERTPCRMYAGEERTFDFLLQSGQQDAVIKFEVLDDAGGIAQIVGDNEFTLLAGEEANAELKVKIPESLNLESVKVIIKFTEISAKNSGQVGLSPSFTMALPIDIGEEVVTASSSGKDNVFFVIAVVLVLAVLIAITVVLVKNRE